MKEEKGKESPGEKPGERIGVTDPIWGTDQLETWNKWTGKIIGADWDHTPDWGRGQKKQLVLTVQPTSYDGNQRTIFFPLSLAERSKWGMLQEALEVCGLIGDRAITSADDLVGLEMGWEEEEVEFGTDENGETILSRVILPVELLEDNEEENEEDEDLPALILEAVEKEPRPISDLYSEYNSPKKAVLSSVKDLEKDGKIVYEDGVVTAVE